MFYFYMWLKFLNLKEWHKNCLWIFFCQRICLLIKTNAQTVLKIFFWSKKFVCDLIWNATCNYPRSTASLSEWIINLESFSTPRLILLFYNMRKMRCVKVNWFLQVITQLFRGRDGGQGQKRYWDLHLLTATLYNTHCFWCVMPCNSKFYC